MSAIAAVFSADAGDHVGAMTAMLNAASHRAPGPPRTWHTGPVVLGCRERQLETALAVDPSSGRVIVFDGRIDNRDELIALLGLTSAATDAEFVLAGCERWGDDAPALLLGDFAFALWDPAARKVFCARDPFGQRPLFYGRAGHIVAIGSEPQQVLSHPAIPAQINEGVVAEHLAGTRTTIDETVWRDVRRLPPAHALVAAENSLRVWRYWDFNPDARVEHGRPDAYAEHFAQLFDTAVKRRARGATRGVGVFLSGGVDSSAIAGVAARLHRAGELPVVHAFSIAFPNSACDESPFIDAVVRHSGIPSTRLDAAAATRAHIEAEIARYRDLPAFPNGLALDPLRARAAADVDVVLTGYGGDEWFSGCCPLQLADLVRPRGRSRAALARALIAPRIPRTLMPAARAIAGARPPAFEWIRPDFQASTALRDRLRRPERRRFRTRAQRYIHSITSSAVQVIGDELEDRAAAFAGIEQRQPFNDRCVAEFGFALPQSQRRSGDETKVVIRRALARDLPEQVLRRSDKAEFSSTFVESVECLGGRHLFEDLWTARAGWVDAAAATGQYDRLVNLYRAGDAAYISLTGPVWAVAAVELWLRQIEGVTRDRAKHA